MVLIYKRYTTFRCYQETFNCSHTFSLLSRTIFIFAKLFFLFIFVTANIRETYQNIKGDTQHVSFFCHNSLIKKPKYKGNVVMLSLRPIL